MTTIVIAIIVIGIIAWTMRPLFSNTAQRADPCKHWNTRCLHGDEILAYQKLPLNPKKPLVICRQVCIDCQVGLDRPAICTVTPNEHRWVGPWVFYNLEDK